MLPDVSRAFPEARFPFERPRVAVTVVAGAAAAGIARRSRLSLPAREAIAALASLAPAALALRGGELASYHGAEHISIGTYETGEPATKEHDRCGGHLVGPLLLTTAAASALAARAPARTRPAARAAGAVGAVGAAVEVFAWMGRHPDTRSRGPSRDPDTSCRPAFRRPSLRPAQLEVAEAALAACLGAEADRSLARPMKHAAARRARRSRLPRLSGSQKSCRAETVPCYTCSPLGAASAGRPRSEPAAGVGCSLDRLCSPARTPFFTAEPDPDSPPRWRVLRGRSERHGSRRVVARGVSSRGAFDLLFVDADDAKDDVDATIGLLAPGGTAVLDDVSGPAPALPIGRRVARASATARDRALGDAGAARAPRRPSLALQSRFAACR